MYVGLVTSVLQWSLGTGAGLLPMTQSGRNDGKRKRKVRLRCTREALSAATQQAIKGHPACT